MILWSYKNIRFSYQSFIGLNFVNFCQYYWSFLKLFDYFGVLPADYLKLLVVTVCSVGFECFACLLGFGRGGDHLGR